MVELGRDSRGNAGPDDPSRIGSAGEGGSVPWLARQRVAIPDPADDHLCRPELVERCLRAERRVTVMVAGGGFGKTTLMAECCRTLIARGGSAAWLLLDDDDPGMLDRYLALAFEQTGLDICEPLRDDRALDVPHERSALAWRALERRGTPWVLALDELERVRDAASVELLNSLIRRAPANLRFILACRELPVGLDVAGPVLDGGAQVVAPADLRFSRKEIAAFFDGGLSRRELASMAAETAGWPMALRIAGNHQRTSAEGALRLAVLENWIDARLWADLGDEDRDLVLDAGLFDWVDGPLLEEVLGGYGLLGRLQRVGALQGLLQPAGGATAAWRLHPLVREQCEGRRRRESPERYRRVHRRLAQALARRGEIVAPVRHAAAADDPDLVGRILVDAGGVRLWLSEGADRLVAAMRHVTEETLAMHPRLALVRCLALPAAGRVREARRAFEEADALVDVAVEADAERDLDRLLVRGLMFHISCEPLDSEAARTLIAEVVRATVDVADPILRGAVEYGLCFLADLRAEFDAATEWGARALRSVGDGAAYVRMGVEFELGQVAMAQGRVSDALDWYGRVRRATRSDFLREPRLAAFGAVLAGELDLERNRVSEDVAQRGVPMELYRRCPKFPGFAAASELGVELALETRGSDAALATLDEMYAYADSERLPALVRFLSVLRVSLLVLGGRVAEAERFWRASGLPGDDAGCLDLERQSWREMEALACARLRLLQATRGFGAGRRLAGRLVALAAQRNLQRTRMRGLALWMALEEGAGDRDAAIRCLQDYLGLYAQTDYARPMVRQGEVAVRLLEALLGSVDGGVSVGSVNALLGAARRASADAVPTLSAREADVLRRLATERDGEIARALGITRDGVRYYVKRLFRKFDVHRRRDAVRRARELGLLNEEGSRAD